VRFPAPSPTLARRDSLHDPIVAQCLSPEHTPALHHAARSVCISKIIMSLNANLLRTRGSPLPPLLPGFSRWTGESSLATTAALRNHPHCVVDMTRQRSTGRSRFHYRQARSGRPNGPTRRPKRAPRGQSGRLRPPVQPGAGGSPVVTVAPPRMPGPRHWNPSSPFGGRKIDRFHSAPRTPFCTPRKGSAVRPVAVAGRAAVMRLPGTPDAGRPTWG
jgi:hypothetical protein